MKKLFYLIPLVLLANYELIAQKGTISTEEREFIINYLDLTQSNLLATVNEIDAEKWNYKPADGGWTVAECMEHIVKAERAVFGQLQKILEAPADNSKNLKHEDAWLISKISDRGVKVKTPLSPNGSLQSKEEAIQAFKASRQEIADFLKNKKLALRNHFGRSPYGPADGYQLLIVIAAHSMRHNAQMNEILTGLVN